MKYLLGIDFGGGASKATLIDTCGNIVCENTVEYPTLYPEANACEQNPQDWISALCENSRAVIEKSGIAPSDILCIALDSATHSFLVTDEDFVPLANAVHWTDSRSKSQAKALYEEYGDRIFEKSYHKPDTIWTLPQLIWLRETKPEIFSKAKHIFFEKDYVRYFLTGTYCTDYIEAQGSMLFDCRNTCWDSWLCSLAGINCSMLPKIVKPTDLVGSVTKAAAAQTGLFEGTPVICGTTDTVMEVFASGAVSKGDMTVKLATAGRICVITDKAVPDRHLVNYSHISEGLWYPGTATKSAASAYRWYRDTFGGEYKDLDSGAKEIEIGCNELMFHPYLSGELTPYADPSLCGSFIGMRMLHTKAHFTRAVLEGVTLSLLDSKNYLDSLGFDYKDTATLIGGGAKGDLWSQITADALGITLNITKSSDSSLGSAMLAGIACGVFSDPQDAVSKCIKIEKTVVPNPENTKKYAKLFEKYKKVQSALAPIYKDE